jgi:phage gpG-like protein
MDQLQDLIFQLRELTPALRALGSTPTTAGDASAAGLEKQFDRVVQALARLSTNLDDTTRSEFSRRRATEDFVKSVDRSADALESQRQTVAKNQEQLRAQAREQQRAQGEASKTQRDINRELFQDIIDNNRQVQSYGALLAREQIAQERASKGLFDSLRRINPESVAFQRALLKSREALEELGKLGKSVTEFAGALASGNTKFSSLNPLIDSVSQSLGKMAEAIPFLGSAISGAMQLVASGTKFLMDQMQNSLDTFQQLGAVGALTVEGMKGVQQQFLESGLSLDSYRRVIQENSAALARFGGSVGDGARKFTKFLGTIVDSEAGDELRRLGFSVDAIGESAAAFMTQQTRLGLAQRKSNDELVLGARRYAMELDTISRLTGMQRQQIQAQQDAALSEARFRAKTDELVEQGREDEAKALMDFQTMVSQASPNIAQGLRDLATNNATTQAAQQVLRMGGERILQQVEAGVIGPVEAFKQMQQATKEQLPLMRQLALAIGNETGAFTDYAQASDLVSAKINEAGDIITKQNKQMAKGTDPLTDSAVMAQKNLEQMSRQIQNFGFAVMPAAARAVEEFTGALNKFIQAVSKETGIALPNIGGVGAAGAPRVGPATGESYGRAGQGTLGGSLASTAVGAAVGAAALSAVPVVGTVAGGLIGGALGYLGYEMLGGSTMRPKAADPERIIKFTGGTGTREHFEKLDPAVKAAFVKMAVDYNNLTGEKLQINSAFRSLGEQAAVDPGANPKAAPGMSLHNQGRAIDLQSDQVQALRKMGLLDRHGFKTLANDPPHIYMQDGGIIPARRGGTKVIAGEAGKNEAVVPLPDGKSIPVTFRGIDQIKFENIFRGLDRLLQKINGINTMDANDHAKIMIDSVNRHLSKPSNQDFGPDTINVLEQISSKTGSVDLGINRMVDVMNDMSLRQRNMDPLGASMIDVMNDVSSRQRNMDSVMTSMTDVMKDMPINQQTIDRLAMILDSGIDNISSRMQAVDKAANIMTDSKIYQNILQRGISTSFDLGMVKTNEVLVPELRGLVAEEINNLDIRSTNVENTVSQVREEFGRLLSGLIETQQRQGNTVPLLQELVTLQRDQNSTSLKLLQAAQN